MNSLYSYVYFQLSEVMIATVLNRMEQYHLLLFFWLMSLLCFYAEGGVSRRQGQQGMWRRRGLRAGGPAAPVRECPGN